MVSVIKRSSYHAAVCLFFCLDWFIFIIWCYKTGVQNNDWLVTLTGLSQAAVWVGPRLAGSIYNHYCADSGSKWHYQHVMAVPILKMFWFYIFYGGKKCKSSIHQWYWLKYSEHWAVFLLLFLGKTTVSKIENELWNISNTDWPQVYVSEHGILNCTWPEQQFFTASFCVTILLPQVKWIY